MLFAMALIKCHECGTEMSNKAPVCPKCGAPKKRSRGRTIWLALLTVTVVVSKCSPHPVLISGANGCWNYSAEKSAGSVAVPGFAMARRTAWRR